MWAARPPLGRGVMREQMIRYNQRPGRCAGWAPPVGGKDHISARTVAQDVRRPNTRIDAAIGVRNGEIASVGQGAT